MKKGDTVFYSVRQQAYRARVETVHQDGTVSIRSLFPVDASGKDQPGYLGFKYRADPDVLRASHMEAAS